MGHHSLFPSASPPPPLPPPPADSALVRSWLERGRRRGGSRPRPRPHPPGMIDTVYHVKFRTYLYGSALCPLTNFSRFWGVVISWHINYCASELHISQLVSPRKCRKNMPCFLWEINNPKRTSIISESILALAAPLRTLTPRRRIRRCTQL